MKFCESHWDKLKEAIKIRGLDKYLAKNGEEASKGMEEGKPDPLLGAHNSIVGNGMDIAGMLLLMPNDDGSDRCPLCFLRDVVAKVPCDCGDPSCTVEAKQAVFDSWIDRAADDELERFGGKRASS